MPAVISPAWVMSEPPFAATEWHTRQPVPSQVLLLLQSEAFAAPEEKPAAMVGAVESARMARVAAPMRTLTLFTVV